MPGYREPLSELLEIRDLELEVLAELMEEPVHGHNHGRKKAIGGEWAPLETAPGDALSWKRFAQPRKHGTAYVYTKIKCRCAKCRAWRREYRKKYSGTTPGNEEERFQVSSPRKKHARSAERPRPSDAQGHGEQR